VTDSDERVRAMTRKVIAERGGMRWSPELSERLEEVAAISAEVRRRLRPDDRGQFSDLQLRRALTEEHLRREAAGELPPPFEQREEPE
jgi:hypothetical protein